MFLLFGEIHLFLVHVGSEEEEEEDNIFLVKEILSTGMWLSCTCSLFIIVANFRD